MCIDIFSAKFALAKTKKLEYENNNPLLKSVMDTIEKGIISQMKLGRYFYMLLIADEYISIDIFSVVHILIKQGYAISMVRVHAKYSQSYTAVIISWDNSYIGQKNNNIVSCIKNNIIPFNDMELIEFTIEDVNNAYDCLYKEIYKKMVKGDVLNGNWR